MNKEYLNGRQDGIQDIFHNRKRKWDIHGNCVCAEWALRFNVEKHFSKDYVNGYNYAFREYHNCIA